MTTTQLMTTRLMGLVAVLFFLWLAAALVLDPAAPFGFRATAALMGVGFLALLVRWHRRKDAKAHETTHPRASSAPPSPFGVGSGRRHFPFERQHNDAAGHDRRLHVDQ